MLRNHDDPPVLELDNVSVRRNGVDILDDVSIEVDRSQRWVVLGSNGSGKTTLLRIAALAQRPTTGNVSVLGHPVGGVDVRTLRPMIGVLSPALGDRLRPALTAHDAVVTARHAALEPWWHHYDADDHARANECLGRMGVGRFASRAIGTLSSGERQRVLLARTLMTEPRLVLLDEPTAGLDVAGREQVVNALDELAADRASPAVVLVSHHLEEVPARVTHALLLRDGAVVAKGLVEDVVGADQLSITFGLELCVERADDGRFRAWAPRR